MRTVILPLVALLSFSSASSAAGYIGIGYGETDYDAGDISTFDDPNGFEFHFGFESSKSLAFELGIVNFGEADDGIPPEWHLEADSLAFSLLGKAPLGARSEIYFQFGLHMWDAELSEDGFGVFAEDDGNDFFYGFGIKFGINEKIGLGMRYNNFDFDGDDVTRLTINAQVGFD